MTMCVAHQFPYIDRIIDAIEKGDERARTAFGRHVHWGYWSNPAEADLTLSGYAHASDSLSDAVIDATNIRDCYRVLDAGCGFGGTLGMLESRFEGLKLHGLNIDARQMARATTMSPDRVRFAVADACALPYRNDYFDTVLSVEAIFHFPSRLQFLAEASRTLVPGGQVAITDFVPRFMIPFLWDRFDVRFKPEVNRVFGHADMRCTLAEYRRLASKAGLILQKVIDITRGTLPGYKALVSLARMMGPNPDEAEGVVRRVERASRFGLLRYLIIVFSKPHHL